MFGGQYLGVLEAMAWCVGDNFWVGVWVPLCVLCAISGCVVATSGFVGSNIWVCLWKYLGMW